MMQEESSFNEEEWQEVKEVSCQEHVSVVHEFLPLGLCDIEAIPSSSHRIKHQQRRVRQH